MRDPMVEADALIEAENWAAAARVLSRVLVNDPRNAFAMYRLAGVAEAMSKSEDAILLFERAIQVDPDHAGLRNDFGSVLANHGRPDEAEEQLRRALKIDPNLAAAWTSLSSLALRRHQPLLAIELAKRAINLGPYVSKPYENLAVARWHIGDARGAADAMAEAARLIPGDPVILSMIAFMSLYDDRLALSARVAAHRAAGEALVRAAPTTWSEAPLRDPDPERRLRVAFLSPDFRAHSVAYFLEGWIGRLDSERIQTFLYHTAADCDETSERFRTSGATWRHVWRLNDARLRTQLAKDRIDVLVDLANHTEGHRLATLARRAAPIQLSMIGYPGPTGLPTIDARLSDAIVDPQADSANETLALLAPSYWCYRPPSEAPAPQPRRDGSPFTFGSFAVLAKVSEGSLRAWSRILAEAPQARLVLKTRSLGDPAVARITRERLAAAGIDPARVELLGHVDTFSGHLEAYGIADLLLDTFPYGGATITCEALWMGVPILTFPGDTHTARMGSSILHAAGLQEFIATSEKDYVARATGMARDPARWAPRVDIRARVAQSPLVDGERYAREVERAIRTVWRRTCDSRDLAKTRDLR